MKIILPKLFILYNITPPPSKHRIMNPYTYEALQELGEEPDTNIIMQYASAINKLHNASNANCRIASYLLAEIYWIGLFNVERNPNKAFIYMYNALGMIL
jgi:hypothetical protein